MEINIDDMENYIVSARKYRPVNFSSVIGQSSLTVTLMNAIRNGKLAHAYLFCGPRGVGKTTCARIFAKTINCLSPKENGDACNECESCKAFDEQRSFNIYEIDAASNNGIDEIRVLIDQVRIPPQVGKYKVFIIDEVHMLSTGAFNAFLKTLEEPPRHAIFILATTEKHKLLPTIISRCQIYDFNRMKVDDIVAHLANVAAKEGYKCEPAALNVIAQKADGGMRDALSIFDQVASFCDGNITYQRTIETLNVLDSDYFFKFTDYFLDNKLTECMLTLNEILEKGFQGQHFINGLASHLRNLLVSKDPQTVKLIEASDDIRARYQQQAQRCQQKFLYTAIKICSDCDLNYKNSNNKRLLVELSLIQITQAAQGEDVPGSGHGPRKILAPIFAQMRKLSAADNAVPSAERAQASNAAVPQTTTSTNETKAEHIKTMPPDNGITKNASTGRVLRGLSFLHSKADKEENSNNGSGISDVSRPAAAATHATYEDQPFDITRLMTTLREFASQLPQSETAMAKRIDALEPVILDDKVTFEVIADNPTVEQQLNKYVADIQQFIRPRLQNHKAAMTVRLREQNDRKKAFNKYEQFEMMCQQNPMLNKMKDLLYLELE